MPKDKGPDNKIIRELIEEASEEAVVNVDGVSQVLDIKLDGDSDAKTVDMKIYINVVYGYKIPAVSWDVQNAVKIAVRTVTGYDAKTIDIHIQGVDKAALKGKDK